MYYPDEKVLLRDANGPLWEEIARTGAVVQFHTRPPFADQVAEVARRCPENVLIIDHMGYPQVGEEPAAFQPILDLARFDNVHSKLSDVHGRSKERFPYSDVHPYIKLLLDAFGEDRTMWGTGFPGHHRQKHNWPTLKDELRLIQEGLTFLTERQKEKVLGETAARIWGIQ
jgi:predicted TIM-barrel fold metal-dependent hydrolase